MRECSTTTYDMMEHSLTIQTREPCLVRPTIRHSRHCMLSTWLLCDFCESCCSLFIFAAAQLFIQAIPRGFLPILHHRRSYETKYSSCFGWRVILLYQRTELFLRYMDTRKHCGGIDMIRGEAVTVTIRPAKARRPSENVWEYYYKGHSWHLQMMCFIMVIHCSTFLLGL